MRCAAVLRRAWGGTGSGPPGSGIRVVAAADSDGPAMPAAQPPAIAQTRMGYVEEPRKSALTQRGHADGDAVLPTTAPPQGRGGPQEARAEQGSPLRVALAVWAAAGSAEGAWNLESSLRAGCHGRAAFGGS